MSCRDTVLFWQGFCVAGLRSFSHRARATQPFPLCVRQNRYLIVLYYNPAKMKAKANLKEQEEALRKLQERHGVDGEQHPTSKAR